MFRHFAPQKNKKINKNLRYFLDIFFLFIVKCDFLARKSAVLYEIEDLKK
jgi:hypothetical protein